MLTAAAAHHALPVASCWAGPGGAPVRLATGACAVMHEGSRQLASASLQACVSPTLKRAPARKAAPTRRPPHRHGAARQAGVAGAAGEPAQAAGRAVERLAGRERVGQRAPARGVGLHGLAGLRGPAARRQALFLVDAVNVAAVEQQDAPARAARRGSAARRQRPSSGVRGHGGRAQWGVAPPPIAGAALEQAPR